MKRSGYIFALIILAFAGCTQNKDKASTSVYNSHLTPGKHSYIALFNKDSASLTIDVTAGGKITGNLYISIVKDTTAKPEPNSGDITGEFRGDTLFADYNFNSGANKTMYSNPIALLHKGDTLIMGSGRIMNYLGRSYFDSHTLSFNKSKFRFIPVSGKK